jgi:hypothetical protein
VDQSSGTGVGGVRVHALARRDFCRGRALCSYWFYQANDMTHSPAHASTAQRADGIYRALSDACAVWCKDGVA